MKTFGLALLFGLGGYPAGVLLGALLVSMTSTKPDRSQEAAMTGFFFVGPAIGLLSFIGGLIYLLNR